MQDILINCVSNYFLYSFDSSKRIRRRAPAAFHVHPGPVLHLRPGWECQLDAPTLRDQRLWLPDGEREGCAPVHETNPGSERTGNRRANGRHFYFLLDGKYIHREQ